MRLAEETGKTVLLGWAAERLIASVLGNRSGAGHGPTRH